LRLQYHGNKRERRMAVPTYRHPELSTVSLARPIEAAGVTLPSGSRGSVVHVFAEEKAYIVEFTAPVHAVVAVEAGLIEK
jgi:Domain of unknown function (DUF4926)